MEFREQDGNLSNMIREVGRSWMRMKLIDNTENMAYITSLNKVKQRSDRIQTQILIYRVITLAIKLKH